MASHPAAAISASADAEEVVGSFVGASGKKGVDYDYESGAAWLASTPTETPIRPLVSIVDAHHHFLGKRSADNDMEIRVHNLNNL